MSLTQELVSTEIPDKNKSETLERLRNKHKSKTRAKAILDEAKQQGILKILEHSETPEPKEELDKILNEWSKIDIQEKKKKTSNRSSVGKKNKKGESKNVKLKKEEKTQQSSSETDTPNTSEADIKSESDSHTESDRDEPAFVTKAIVAVETKPEEPIYKPQSVVVQNKKNNKSKIVKETNDKVTTQAKKRQPNTTLSEPEKTTTNNRNNERKWHNNTVEKQTRHNPSNKQKASEIPHKKLDSPKNDSVKPKPKTLSTTTKTTNVDEFPVIKQHSSDENKIHKITETAWNKPLIIKKTEETTCLKPENEKSTEETVLINGQIQSDEPEKTVHDKEPDPVIHNEPIPETQHQNDKAPTNDVHLNADASPYVPSNQPFVHQQFNPYYRFQPPMFNGGIMPVNESYLIADPLTNIPYMVSTNVVPLITVSVPVFVPVPYEHFMQGQERKTL